MALYYGPLMKQRQYGVFFQCFFTKAFLSCLFLLSEPGKAGVIFFIYFFIC